LPLPRLRLALLLLAACCACSPAPEPPPPPDPSRVRPVLLIGLDGFEWNLVLELLRQQRLPVLGALMERGVYGQLETLLPTTSPRIWNSVATGVTPEEHGITAFNVGKGEQRRLANSLDRQRKALWNIATDHDQRTAVVGWWSTWPVEPVMGVMVAQVNVTGPAIGSLGVGIGKGNLFAGMDRQVHPPQRQDELLAHVPQALQQLPAETRRVFGRQWDPALGAVPDRLWRNSLWSLRADLVYLRIAHHLLRHDAPYAFFALYLGSPDVLGHRFWRYMEPERYDHPPSQQELAALGDYLPACYAWIDAQLGELLAAAPADATVLLLSDHGMKPINPHGEYLPSDANQQLVSAHHYRAQPAFFVAAGPNLRRSGQRPQSREDVPELGSIYDLLPTICALLDLPLARDLQGQVIEDIVHPAFLGQHPPRQVESYGDEAWLEARRTADADGRQIDGQRQEQLRALGYLD